MMQLPGLIAGGVGALVKKSQGVKAFTVDFVLALLFFSVSVGLFTVDRSNAFPAPPPPELMSAVAQHQLLLFGVAGPETATLQPAAFKVVPPFVPGTTPAMRFQIISLLAIALGTLVAFNLAVWRYLRRVYASPRRGPWGRGLSH